MNISSKLLSVQWSLQGLLAKYDVSAGRILQYETDGGVKLWKILFHWSLINSSRQGLFMMEAVDFELDKIWTC